jgi:hypothetical protein
VRKPQIRTTTLALGATLVAVSLSFSACGGSDEEAAVKAAYTKELAALANGNGKQFCDGLDAASAQRIASVAQTPSCAAGVAVLRNSLSAQQREMLKMIKVKKVVVDGSKARIQASVPADLKPSGFTGNSQMLKQNGKWLLDTNTHISGG